jgi:hypothetical protein
MYTNVVKFYIIEEEKVVSHIMSCVYKVGSLFAGVGGVCLGFQNAHVENKKFKTRYGQMKWMNMHVKHTEIISATS